MHKKSTTETNILLCKLCMDRQCDVLFQPCGHLISCSTCASLITECAVCRKPIENVIKVYL